MKDKRVIAFYLPQYHPFKENDEWWGKGFTEWTNVTKAKSRFPGHYQPHLPTDLGFYDLRVPEVREQQAQMARDAGIYGFCYYHYWFNGKLLMERPLKEVLGSGKPDFPFMICWANENWTRAWDGGEKEILIQQNYTKEDARNHIKWLIPYLKDPRYIKIDNKPVVAIYRTAIIPDIEGMITVWRDEAKKQDLELYITRIESMGDKGKDFIKTGIDAAIDFQPHNIDYYMRYKNLIPRIFNKLSRMCGKSNLLPILLDYRKFVKYQCNLSIPNYKVYPCVTPNWDNSPRRKNSFFAFTGSTPKIFGKWLQHVVQHFVPYSEDENLIFINAWNEWAEGNHLEPDRKWGRGYIEECKRVLR